jgi:hypothetical protein
MDAERRFQAGQHLGPFVGRNDARDLMQAGDIVAEQHDDIRIQRVGTIDDGLDPVQRHPGVAGMNVGDHGDLQRKIRRPLARGRVIAGDPKPQHRLDADAVSGGRDGESRQAADGTDEMTARDHGGPIVMQRLDAIRLERKWGAFVQTLCTRLPGIHDDPSTQHLRGSALAQIRTCADQDLRRSVVALVGAEQAEL